VLELFAAALLEKQIVVICSNLGVLSAIVLSVMPMIRPFQWQSLLLPVSSIILFPVSFRFLFNYVLFNIISVISVLFEWPHGGLGFDLTDSTFFWWLSFAPFFSHVYHTLSL
jgi:hypothetical protein